MEPGQFDFLAGEKLDKKQKGGENVNKKMNGL